MTRALPALPDGPVLTTSAVPRPRNYLLIRSWEFCRMKKL